MKDPELAKLYVFTNKMDVELYMLGPFMMYRIGRHVDGRDVVTEDHCSLLNVAAKFAK